MNKMDLTEHEICDQYIRPAIVNAGWTDVMIQEDFRTSAGSKLATRSTTVQRTTRTVNLRLTYRDVPMAIVVSKANSHPIGACMQEALAFAADLQVPFVYSSNGDGFLEHDETGTTSCRIERGLPLESFPGPEELWNRLKMAEVLAPAQSHPFHRHNPDRAEKPVYGTNNEK